MSLKLFKNPAKGGILEIAAIALPMVAAQSCDTMMIFTDRMFLSRLSPEHMNAAMGGGLTVFMMMTFFIGLIGYVTALSAQYLGSGKKERCAAVVSQAFIFSLIAYPMIVAAGPLAHKLFEVMGIAHGQMALQKKYFDIMLYAVILSLLRIAISSFFSGIGRTKIVMIASFTAMLSNIFFNYIFIFGKLGLPAMGIAGAAYGTVLGNICALSILAAAYFGRKNRAEFKVLPVIRFDGSVMTKLMRYGAPTGAELLLNIVAFNILVMTFHSCGPVTATATTIMFNWDLVSFVPLLGIEIGVTSLVGRYMGAREPETAQKSAMSAFKLGTAYSLFILTLFMILPHGLVSVFKPASASGTFEAAVPLAVYMIRMASLYVIVEAMLLSFIGALRGAGDTLWAMGMSVSVHWVIAAAAMFLLRVLHAGPEAAWTVAVIIFFFFAILVYLRYHRGAWKNIRVIEPEAVYVPGDVFHETGDV